MLDTKGIFIGIEANLFSNLISSLVWYIWYLILAGITILILASPSGKHPCLSPDNLRYYLTAWLVEVMTISLIVTLSFFERSLIYYISIGLLVLQLITPVILSFPSVRAFSSFLVKRMSMSNLGIYNGIIRFNNTRVNNEIWGNLISESRLNSSDRVRILHIQDIPSYKEWCCFQIASQISLPVLSLHLLQNILHWGPSRGSFLFTLS